MLPCLRHRTAIGGNHEHCGIDRTNPGQHVANEFFMAGDINKTKRLVGAQPVIGEAEINTDAACFFLRQSVCIDPG